MIICEYLGAFLLGASATALGLLLSCLSKNQAGAFLGGVVVLLTAMFINQLTIAFNLPQGLARGINFISLAYHYENFTKGLIDSRGLAYFVLSTCLFLYLNTKVILFRKWK
jgi:ABC-2 type transport system permease protein